MAGKTINTALINAILFGDFARIKRMLAEAQAEHKKNPPKNNPHNIQAIKDSPIADSIEYAIAAIQRGDVAIFKYLVEQGMALVDVEGTYGHSKSQSALHVAVKAGHPEIVKELLLLNHIYPALKDHHGKTPLDLAKRFPDKQVSKFMCEAIQIAIQERGNSEQLRKSISKLSTDNLRTPVKSDFIPVEGGYSAGNYSKEFQDGAKLWIQAKTQNLEKYKKLRAKVAEVAKREEIFLTKAYDGSLQEPDITSFLAFRGSINVTTGYNLGNQNALHLAAENGHFKCVELLLKHGINYSVPDANGNTAYDLANQKFQRMTNPDFKEEYRKITTTIEIAGGKPLSPAKPLPSVSDPKGSKAFGRNNINNGITNIYHPG